MALEVHGQHYLFKPGRAPPANVVKRLSRRFPLLDGDDEPGEIGIILSANQRVPVYLPPFSYNPLHDLESLWWLTSFFTFEFSSELFGKPVPHKESEGKARRSDRHCFPTELFVIEEQPGHSSSIWTGQQSCKFV